MLCSSLYLGKPRNMTKKKPSTTPFDVMLGVSWLQRFSAGEAMLCLQIALSHFAAWRENVLFRKILRTEAYRVHSIVLCFLIYFFAQEERYLLFSLCSILARRFYCPHSRFTLKLSQSAAAHPWSPRPSQAGRDDTHVFSAPLRSALCTYPVRP